MNLCHLNIKKAYCYEWRTRIKYNFFYDTKKLLLRIKLLGIFVKAPHGLVTGITGGGKTYFFILCDS